jgi:hypothetical protein
MIYKNSAMSVVSATFTGCDPTRKKGLDGSQLSTAHQLTLLAVSDLTPRLLLRSHASRAVHASSSAASLGIWGALQTYKQVEGYGVYGKNTTRTIGLEPNQSQKM